MSDTQEKNINSEFNLAIPQDVFADIIINFLGQKENISYNKKVYFEIGLQDIKQFYYLLINKIEKEQFTHIQLFQTAINYNDDTSRRLNTIESLEKFFETRNVYPVSVTMSWSIVLKFPNSKTIETQKIDLTFSISDEIIDGSVILSIDHTNQSWGIEVQNLFLNQIKKTAILPNKKVENYRKNLTDSKVYIAVITICFLIFLGSIFSMLFEPKFNLFDHQREYSNYEISTNIINLSKNKSELMVMLYAINKFSDNELSEFSKEFVTKGELKRNIESYLLEKENAKSIPIALTPLAIITIFFILRRYYYRTYIEFYKERSFILLTDEAKKARSLFKKSKNKVKFYAFNTLILGVLSGLIASYIYSFLINQ